MNDETLRRPADRSPARPELFRLAAVVVLALVAGLVLWLVLRDGGGSSTAQRRSSGAVAVSVAQLRNLAASIGHPLFWVGPVSGATYELTRQPNGNVYIRYLPSGVHVGAAKPYLTVGTYPFPGAYGAIAAVARDSGSTALRLPDGALGEVSTSAPDSVHVAFPGVDYQVEVFDPTPGAATALVASGRLTHLGSLDAGSAPPPTAASPAGLKSLARSLGHPIYWVGPKPGFTYELRRAPDGRVFVRYLPRGVKIGSTRPYLTVATYPFRGALGALRALARQQHATAIALPGGGLALVDRGYPKSIHLAYPGSAYQVEVFAPSPAAARRLVTSGRVSTVG